MKYFILMGTLLFGCTTLPTPEIISDPEDPDIYTLRLQIGDKYKDYYQESFWQAGEKLCPEGFGILESTSYPTTLDEKLHNPSYYNWVIDCANGL